MTNGRIYGKRISIDSRIAQKFYDQRARQLGNDLSAVNLSVNPDISRKRDVCEKIRTVPLLELKGNESVLEIGCGLGRFPEVLAGKIRQYLGVDSSEEMIRIAQHKYRKHSNILFQTLSAEDLSPENMSLSPPFDRIIVMGLFVYLNDDAAEVLVDRMARFASAASIIYIRESVSLVKQRLTLKNFFSRELGTHYSAIYRTPEEYRQLFRKHLIPQGFSLNHSDVLLSKELGARDETNQQFFLLSRKG